ADPREVEVPLVIHVRHLQPDLIDVAREHEARRAPRVQRGDRVAVHERLHLLAPHAGGRGLETGRSGGVEQTLQELRRRFCHGCAGVESGMPSRRRTLSAAAPVASVGWWSTRMGIADRRIRLSGRTTTRRIAERRVHGSFCRNTKLPSDWTIGLPLYRTTGCSTWG